jgi:hypothetical protein
MLIRAANIYTAAWLTRWGVPRLVLPPAAGDEHINHELGQLMGEYTYDSVRFFSALGWW